MSADIKDMAKTALMHAKMGDDTLATWMLEDMVAELTRLDGERRHAALVYAKGGFSEKHEAIVREHDEALKRARNVYAAAAGAVARENEKRAAAAAMEREKARSESTAREPTDAELIAEALARLGLEGANAA